MAISKSRIALVTTGGTVAMTAEGSSGIAPKLTSDALIAAVPEIAEHADLHPVDLFLKPSAHLTFGDLCTLIDTLNGVQSTVDGIVITIGTDVLEEVAFALSCLWRHDIPVVLTGAMRRADRPGADGPVNILHAILVAAAPCARGAGVLVTLNGQIISGTQVAKTHSFAPHAFASHAIGHIAEDRVRLFSKPVRPDLTLECGPQRSVIPVIEGGFDFAVDDLAVLDASRIDALIVAMTGAGHTSGVAADILATLADDKPVLFATRTGAGETLVNTYGYQGSESDLIAKGLIPSETLSARQARMLLMLGFSQGDRSSARARQLITDYHRTL